MFLEGQGFSNLPLRGRKSLKVLLSPSLLSHRLFFVNFKGSIPARKFGIFLERSLWARVRSCDPPGL